MNEWFGGLTGLEQVYFISAVLGGVLFSVRVLLMIVGVDHEGDPGDIGDIGDVDVSDINDGGFDGGHDTDASFKVLSLQSITAFFMMFGLVGFALLHDSETTNLVSLAGAAVAGFGSMYGAAKLFSSLLKLQSSGTLNMKNAIGNEGLVYLTIPADGRGKVQIEVQEHLKVFEAVCDNNEEIPTGERVTVKDITVGDTLVVAKLGG